MAACVSLGSLFVSQLHRCEHLEAVRLEDTACHKHSSKQECRSIASKPTLHGAPFIIISSRMKCA